MNRAPVVPMHPAVIVAGIVLAAGTFFSGRAARAEFPLPLPHEIHREVREHVGHVLRTLDRIPERILRESARDLEVFFGGSVYYGPHHHNHMTYNFPVWIDGSVFYRPYSYCNDRLYGSYSYRPQIWIGWGQESQGHWCNHHHGYYPTNGHACFRSRGYRSWAPVSPRHYGDHYSWRYQRNQGWDQSRGWRDGRRDSPHAWRQPQGYDHQRSTHGRNWREQQRSHRPQGQSDRLRQRDSKRDFKRDSKNTHRSHQGWNK